MTNVNGGELDRDVTAALRTVLAAGGLKPSVLTEPFNESITFSFIYTEECYSTDRQYGGQCNQRNHEAR